MVLKVHQGTVRSDVNLCPGCRFSFRTTGALTGRQTIVCNALHPPKQLREPIAQCSAFSDRTTPSLDQMEEIAWSLQTDKGGRSVGFLSPDETRQRGSTPRVGF